MKKTLVVLAVVLVLSVLALSLVACNAKIYKTDDIKGNLEKAGYSVTVLSAESFETLYSYSDIKPSTYEGFDKAIQATKSENNVVKEAIIIFFFDKVDNADKQSTVCVDLGKGVKNTVGEDVEVKMGSHNNIIYAGTANAVSAMGIKF